MTVKTQVKRTMVQWAGSNHYVTTPWPVSLNTKVCNLIFDFNFFVGIEAVLKIANLIHGQKPFKK